MDYQQKKYDYRKKLLTIYYNANAGHIGCSLSCMDILIALFEIKANRERVILSKGHAAAALYTVLHFTEEINDQALKTFYKNGTKLSAHPSAHSFENIPFALGSLGHGFPIGCGIAYANKLQKNKEAVYVILSDGETNEGTTWEAAHFAIAKKLDNLILVIDKNKLQGFGYTADVLGDTAAYEKWKAIGFDVVEMDGHNVQALTSKILEYRNTNNGLPKLIIANTVKGKGVDFMENKLEWHYLPMTADLYEKALVSLDKNYNA
jgi:transketolase